MASIIYNDVANLIIRVALITPSLCDDAKKGEYSFFRPSHDVFQLDKYQQ